MDDSHSPSFTPAPLTLTEDYYLNRINIAIFAITIAFSPCCRVCCTGVCLYCSLPIYLPTPHWVMMTILFLPLPTTKASICCHSLCDRIPARPHRIAGISNHAMAITIITHNHKQTTPAITVTVSRQNAIFDVCCFASILQKIHS